jgi:hypothetical protein
LDVGERTNLSPEERTTEKKMEEAQNDGKMAGCIVCLEIE